jgi:hypothetical protein
MTTAASTAKARRITRRAPARAKASLHAMSDHRFYAYLVYRLGLAVLATIVIFRVTGKG